MALPNSFLTCLIFQEVVENVGIDVHEEDQLGNLPEVYSVVNMLFDFCSFFVEQLFEVSFVMVRGEKDFGLF